MDKNFNAPNLHRTLSRRGNPTMRTFGKIAASISANVLARSMTASVMGLH